MKSKLFFLIFFVNSFLLNGQDIFVNQNANGLNNGQNWIDAYQNLDSALQNAQSGDAIWVAEGIYRPNGNDRGASFILNNLNLIGGFLGTELNIDERDYIQNKTFLCGDIGQQDDPSDNCYSVTKIYNNGSQVLLDGFIIQNGNGDGGYNPHGGGIQIQNSSILIRNCVFLNNYSEYGGAVGSYNTFSYARFENCKFISNSAMYGGAVSYQLTNYSTNQVFIGCLFNNNTATYDGGALYMWKGSFVGVNCTFVDNSTCLYSYDYNSYHTIKFVNSLFYNNGVDDDFFSMFNFQHENEAREFKYCLFPSTTIIPDYQTFQIGNIFDTPEFLNSLGNDNEPGTFDDDYRISFDSPGRNMGTMSNEAQTYLLDYDYYGNERVNEDTIDIGAYESFIATYIENNSLENDLTVYPNPTNGIINFEFEGKNIQKLIISDITGKEVITKIDMQQYETIDLSDLNCGVYFINIQKNNEICTKKIVVY